MAVRFSRTLTFAIAGIGATALEPAHAVEFTLGDTNVSFVSAVTAGFGMRLNDPSADLLGRPGSQGFLADTQSAHLGDLNYKQGDFFAGYIKGNHELLFKFPDDYKFFVRGAWIHDFAATDTAFAPLASESRVAVARDARLYDLWASKDFDLAGNSARVRIGNQVVSWGESLFVAGGINQTNALDLQRYTLPGVPLKEVVLPAPMISLASAIGPDINVEGYYEFAWNGNRLIPSGTYFSTGDYIGPGRTPVWFTWDPRYAAALGGIQTAAGGPLITNPEVAAVAAANNGYSFIAPDGSTAVGAPFIDDKNARGSGQFGISGHYRPPDTSLDIGLYFERYHEKNPYLKYIPNASLAAGFNAQWIYPENRTLYGVSVNFPIDDWAIGMELSYRPKDPILVDPFSCGDLGGSGPNCHGDYRTWRDTDRYQAHLTWWRTINSNNDDIPGWIVKHAGAQSSNVQGELVDVHYPGVHGDSTIEGLGLLANLTVNNAGGQRHFGTEDSLGFIAYFDMTYDGTLIPGWQIIPNITFSVGISGDTPNENYTWFEGVRSTTMAVSFTSLPPDWVFNVQYVTYDGGDPTFIRNFYKDRDWFGMTLTRNF